MYSFSTGLNQIIILAKALPSFWGFRYKLIADNSDRGEDCPYAQRAARLYFEDKEAIAIRPILLALRDQINILLEYIDDETNDQKSWTRISDDSL